MALDPEEFDAYLQALGLESLRDEAALIRAKVRAHLGSDGDDRRELPLLLRAIEVLVRVVQADRSAQRHASARSQDLTKVVEEVLAGLDDGEAASDDGDAASDCRGGGTASDCGRMAGTATAVGPMTAKEASDGTVVPSPSGTAVLVPAIRPQSEAASPPSAAGAPTEGCPSARAGERA